MCLNYFIFSMLMNIVVKKKKVKVKSSKNYVIINIVLLPMLITHSWYLFHIFIERLYILVTTVFT